MKSFDRLKVALYQGELAWERPADNLNLWEQRLSALEPVDLIVLPEMFFTGFSMNTEKLADRNGYGLEWLLEKSLQYKTAVCGSLMIEDAGTCFNRLYFVSPEGDYWTYDKRHLFTMGEENQHYQAGTKRLLLEYRGWTICPLVCYDLRFPVFSRNDLDYDLLIYVANWPERRAEHWKTLVKARAIENMSYVMACNRTGEDGNGVAHSGDSVILDGWGKELVAAGDRETWIYAEISLGELRESREKFPVLRDRDFFSAAWK